MYNKIIILFLISVVFLSLGIYYDSYNMKLISLINCVMGMNLLWLDYKYDLTLLKDTSELILSSPTSSIV